MPKPSSYLKHIGDIATRHSHRTRIITVKWQEGTVKKNGNHEQWAQGIQEDESLGMLHRRELITAGA